MRAVDTTPALLPQSGAWIYTRHMLATSGKPNRFAAALLAALSDAGTDIRFAENADGSVVHVLAWIEPASGEDPRPMTADGVIDFMLGRWRMVCGVVLDRHRGGFERGSRPTGSFPDEKLCQRCHAAFGDQAHLIFDANPHGRWNNYDNSSNDY